MSNHGQTEPFDNRQQEQDERQQYEAWLDKREKEMVDNLDWNLRQMWKQFERDFKQVLEPETKHNQGE